MLPSERRPLSLKVTLGSPLAGLAGVSVAANVPAGFPVPGLGAAANFVESFGTSREANRTHGWDCRLRANSLLKNRLDIHLGETGGERRSWLRGIENVRKRYAVQVAAHNVGLLMRKLFGTGKPRRLQGGGGSSVWIAGNLYWLSGLWGGRGYKQGVVAGSPAMAGPWHAGSPAICLF